MTFLLSTTLQPKKMVLRCHVANNKTQYCEFPVTNYNPLCNMLFSV
jgi:hypothetical protein